MKKGVLKAELLSEFGVDGGGIGAGVDLGLNRNLFPVLTDEFHFFDAADDAAAGNLLDFLLPRKTKFFDLFNDHAACAVDAARKLRELCPALESGEETAYTLVFPADARVEENRISILSAIGTALIGYRVGDVIEWQVPSGKKRLKVEGILYQPEASGRYDL